MLSEFGFKKDYMTALGASQNVVGHEFTHAVFGAVNPDSLGRKKYLEVSSIDEAYADVMGILSTLYTDKKLKKDDPDNWIIGRMELDADAINERYMGSDELNIIQNVLTDNGKIKKRTIVGKRDLCNINFDNQYIGDILGQNEGKKEGLFNKQYSYEKKTGEIYKYPENYIEKNGESYNGRDSYWNSENEHINSVMLSHIAYRMCSSSEVDFSVEQVAKIWYESLRLKYSNKSQFTDFATNLYEASDTLMKEGKINSAQLRFVEMCLADAGIRSMPKYSTVNKSNLEGYKQSSDVDSLDENESENENRFGHEFITVYSVFSGKVTIYEEGKSLSDDKQKEVDEYIKELNEEINQKPIIGKYGQMIKDYEIKLNYKRISKSRMKLFKNILSDSHVFKGIDHYTVNTGGQQNSGSLSAADMCHILWLGATYGWDSTYAMNIYEFGEEMLDGFSD